MCPSNDLAVGNVEEPGSAASRIPVWPLCGLPSRRRPLIAEQPDRRAASTAVECGGCGKLAKRSLVWRTGSKRACGR